MTPEEQLVARREKLLEERDAERARVAKLTAEYNAGKVSEREYKAFGPRFLANYEEKVSAELGRINTHLTAYERAREKGTTYGAERKALNRAEAQREAEYAAKRAGLSQEDIAGLKPSQIIRAAEAKRSYEARAAAKAQPARPTDIVEARVGDKKIIGTRSFVEEKIRREPTTPQTREYLTGGPLSSPLEVSPALAEKLRQEGGGGVQYVAKGYPTSTLKPTKEKTPTAPLAALEAQEQSQGGNISVQPPEYTLPPVRQESKSEQFYQQSAQAFKNVFDPGVSIPERYQYLKGGVLAGTAAGTGAIYELVTEFKPTKKEPFAPLIAAGEFLAAPAIILGNPKAALGSVKRNPIGTAAIILATEGVAKGGSSLIASSRGAAATVEASRALEASRTKGTEVFYPEQGGYTTKTTKTNLKVGKQTYTVEATTAERYGILGQEGLLTEQSRNALALVQRGTGESGGGIAGGGETGFTISVGGEVVGGGRLQTGLASIETGPIETYARTAEGVTSVTGKGGKTTTTPVKAVEYGALREEITAETPLETRSATTGKSTVTTGKGLTEKNIIIQTSGRKTTEISAPKSQEKTLFTIGEERPGTYRLIETGKEVVIEEKPRVDLSYLTSEQGRPYAQKTPILLNPLEKTPEFAFRQLFAPEQYPTTKLTPFERVKTLFQQARKPSEKIRLTTEGDRGYLFSQPSKTAFERLTTKPRERASPQASITETTTKPSTTPRSTRTEAATKQIIAENIGEQVKASQPTIRAATTTIPQEQASTPTTRKIVLREVFETTTEKKPEVKTTPFVSERVTIKPQTVSISRLREGAKIDSRQAAKTFSATLSDEAVKTDEATKTDAAQELAQVTKTGQAEKTQQALRTQLATRTATTTTRPPGGFSTSPPPFIPTPPITPPFISTKEKNKVYTLEVRRQGKFRALRSGLSLGEAIGEGRRVTLGTAAASFRIKGAGGVVSSSSILQNLRPSIFTRSKREEGVVVQRREKRLSSFGEKAEIRPKRGVFGRSKFKSVFTR